MQCISPEFKGKEQVVDEQGRKRYKKEKEKRKEKKKTQKTTRRVRFLGR